MIIKNQNASQLLLRAICRRQAPRLLDDENPSSPTARLFARSRQAIHAGTGGGPNEWRRDRSMAKVFPFHALTLWRSTTSLPWRVRRIYYSSAPGGWGSLFGGRKQTEIASGALTREDPTHQNEGKKKNPPAIKPNKKRKIPSEGGGGRERKFVLRVGAKSGKGGGGKGKKKKKKKKKKKTRKGKGKGSPTKKNKKKKKIKNK